MTQEERDYADGLRKIGRGTIYALERELRFTVKKRKRNQLTKALVMLQTEVARLDLVLGA